MTQPSPDSGFSVSGTIKPIALAAAILLIPPITVAYTSPIVAPMLFSMSRKDSVDIGWRRAGLVGAGLVVIETALYLLFVIGGS